VKSPYYQINNLEETLFIAGNEVTFWFAVTDENNQPIDLSSTDCSWVMCQHGDPDHAILVKTGVISALEPHKFSIKLNSVDTIDLGGRYLHQPIVVDLNGSVFRPGQGNIVVVPAIKEEIVHPRSSI
jgi:hypothetical protein